MKSNNKTRIYLVTDKSGAQHLVEAISIAQAIRHVVKADYTCKPLSAVEVAKCGLVLEIASDTPVAA